MILNPPTEQAALLSFVDRRHPAYACMLAHWNFCDQTYQGGREWFRANIHKYLKEGAVEFRDRLDRAYRFNHTREVTNLVTKYIFKEGVVRNQDDAPDVVRAFWQRATLDGATIDELMKRVSDRASVAGRAWLAVDSTATSAMSRAEERDNEARVYAYVVPQQDVLDFSLDERGELSWILYRLPHREDGDPFHSSGVVLTRYMLWTQDEWMLFEERLRAANATESSSLVSVDASLLDSVSSTLYVSSNKPEDRREIVLIERGENTIAPIIPVVRINHMETDEPYAPPGLVDEIAYLDRTVANYLSNLDAIIQDQTFSQLVMPAQGLMPGADGHQALLDMGTKRIFTYDNEAGGAGPSYISPDATQADLIIKVIKMIIGEIYHSVGMAGERTKQDNAQGIDNSSGVAKAYDFERMNALLAAKGDQLDRAENRLIQIVCAWGGEAIPEDDLVKYPDSYDVRSLPDEFEIAQNLAILEAPAALRREQMTVVVNKLFPRIAKGLMQRILDEMKDWPVDPLDQMAAEIQLQSSGDGQPVKSQIRATTELGGNKQGLAGPTSTSEQGQAGNK